MVCRRKNWRIALTSTAPTSAHLSAACMPPVSTSWTGSHAFSAWRRQIYSGGHLHRVAVARPLRVNFSETLIFAAVQTHLCARATAASSSEPGILVPVFQCIWLQRGRVSGAIRAHSKAPRSMSGALLHSALFSRRSCATATRSGCRSRRLRRRRGWRRSER